LLVGALVGLERHAQFHDSLDRQAVAAMTAATMKLASSDAPYADLDRSVAEWIKLQSATILAKLGSAGQNGDVHETLLKLLADDKLSLDARCQVAALLEMLNYEGATIDGKATADRIIQLTLDVSKDEAKRAKDFVDMHLTGGGFGFNRGPGRMRFNNPDEPEDYDRQVLLMRFGDVQQGLTAVKPMVPADKQGVIDAIIAVIQPAIDAAEDKDIVPLELADKMQKLADDINRAVNPGAAPVTEQPDNEFLQP
jgi:hypothetical protein